MKKYEFVTITVKNNPVYNAETTEHRTVIAEWAAKGYRFVGFVPVTQGPSGKMIDIDLVFEIEA